MVEPLIPSKDKAAQFQYSVYRRVKKWKENRNIKSSEIQYAPLIERKEGGVYRPDIMFDIYRSPTEILFDGIALDQSGREFFIDGALQDYIEEIIREGRDYTFRILIDATLSNFRKPEEWEKRIKRMHEYVFASLREHKVDHAIPVVVLKRGWDNTCKHAKEEEIHIISFDYLEEFLDLILKVSQYGHADEALNEIICCKIEKCEKCGSKDLEYSTLFSCNKHGILTGEIIEERTAIYLEGIKDIILCEDCEYRKWCGGFVKFFAVVCKKCGYIKGMNDKVHPCALVRMHGWFDECDFCQEIDECAVYKRLLEEGILTP